MIGWMARTTLASGPAGCVTINSAPQHWLSFTRGHFREGEIMKPIIELVMVAACWLGAFGAVAAIVAAVIG
jgi:hypothetical protein